MDHDYFEYEDQLSELIRQAASEEGRQIGEDEIGKIASQCIDLFYDLEEDYNDPELVFEDDTFLSGIEELTRAPKKDAVGIVNEDPLSNMIGVYLRDKTYVDDLGIINKVYEECKDLYADLREEYGDEELTLMDDGLQERVAEMIEKHLKGV